MEVLELDGKKYVKAAHAAKQNGYTADYVGQLCRAGKIDSRLVGRTWYVNENAIGTHKRSNVRSNKKKTVQSFEEKLASKEVVEASRLSETRNGAIPAYRKRLLESAITYLPDETEELPYLKQAKIEVEETKKIAPKESEGEKVKITIDDSKKEDVVGFEASALKKAPLKGSISVTEAEDGEVVQNKQQTKNKDTDSSKKAKLIVGDSNNTDDPTIKANKAKKMRVLAKAAHKRQKAASTYKNAPQTQNALITRMIGTVPTALAMSSLILFLGTVFMQSVWVYESAGVEVQSFFELAAAYAIFEHIR